MTDDKELIARLRKADEYEPLGHDGWEAADRIEALIAERNDWESHAIYNAEFVDLAVSYRNERDAARAKLAKAVEVLSFASNVDTADWSEALDVRNQARSTLAEIKGESHD